MDDYAVKGANMLVFVTPHQFIEGICKKLVGKVRIDVEGNSQRDEGQKERTKHDL